MFVANGTLNPQDAKREGGIKACLPRSFEFESPAKFGAGGDVMNGRIEVGERATPSRYKGCEILWTSKNRDSRGCKSFLPALA